MSKCLARLRRPPIDSELHVRRGLDLTHLLVLLACLFVAAPTYATTIDIRVLSATYTATVTVTPYPYLTMQTETATDTVPVDVSLSQTSITDCFNTTWGMGTASADLLEVSAAGSSNCAKADAFADSAWTFTPLSDGLAEIGIDGVAGVAATVGVTLFDVTANQQLWAFARERIAFIHTTVLTQLSADHVYAMHLTATAEGRFDSSSSNLQLSGLRAVPDEGGTLMYLGLGVVFLLLMWRSRT